MFNKRKREREKEDDECTSIMKKFLETEQRKQQF